MRGGWIALIMLLSGVCEGSWSLQRVTDGDGMTSDVSVCGDFVVAGSAALDSMAVYLNVPGYPKCAVYAPSELAGTGFGQQVQCGSNWVAVMGLHSTRFFTLVEGDGSCVVSEVLKVDHHPATALHVRTPLAVWVHEGGATVRRIVEGKSSLTVEEVATLDGLPLANSVDVALDGEVLHLADPHGNILTGYKVGTGDVAFKIPNATCSVLSKHIAMPLSCSPSASTCSVGGHVYVATSNGLHLELNNTLNNNTLQSLAVSAQQKNVPFFAVQGVAPRLVCPVRDDGKLQPSELFVLHGGDAYAYVAPIDGGWCEYGPYSKCSNACGSGKHSRQRVCSCPQPRYNGSECRGDAVEVSSCTSYTSDWVAGTWGKCSAACGEGKRCREVTCVRCDGKPSTTCPKGTKPAECEACLHLPSHWKTSDWGQCSASACLGLGKQQRTVTCVPCSKSFTAAEHDACDPNEQPLKEQACRTIWYEWDILPTCKEVKGSVRPDGCINGIKDTACRSCSRQVVDDELCTAPRPKQSCIINVYAWDFRPWTECDNDCGKGKSERIPFCYLKCDAQKKQVNDALCPSERPNTQTKSCTVYRGGYEWGPWGTCSVTAQCKSGTQSRVCQYKCSGATAPVSNCAGASSKKCSTPCPPPNDDDGCFAADTEVITPTGVMQAKDVLPGQQVLTCTHRESWTGWLTGRRTGCYFTEVYVILHKDTRHTFSLLNITFSGCARTMSVVLSADHILKFNGTWRNAGDVTVGGLLDGVCPGTGEVRLQQVVVTSVTRVQRSDGVYAFATLAGDLVAGNVVASSHAVYMPEWFAEAVHFPLALMYLVTGTTFADPEALFHWYPVGALTWATPFLDDNPWPKGTAPDVVAAVKVLLMVLLVYVVGPLWVIGALQQFFRQRGVKPWAPRGLWHLLLVVYLLGAFGVAEAADDLQPHHRVLNTETDHLVHFTARMETTVRSDTSMEGKSTTGKSTTIREGDIFLKHKKRHDEACFEVEVRNLVEHHSGMMIPMVIQDMTPFNDLPLTVCRRAGEAPLRYYLPDRAEFTSAKKQLVLLLRPLELLATHGDGKANETRQGHHPHDVTHVEHDMSAEYEETHHLRRLDVTSAVNQSHGAVTARVVGRMDVVHSAPHPSRRGLVSLSGHRQVSLDTEESRPSPSRAEAEAISERFVDGCFDTTVPHTELSASVRDHAEVLVPVMRSLVMSKTIPVETKVRVLEVAALRVESVDIIADCADMRTNNTCNIPDNRMQAILFGASYSLLRGHKKQSAKLADAAMRWLEAHGKPHEAIGEVSHVVLHHSHDDHHDAHLNRLLRVAGGNVYASTAILSNAKKVTEAVRKHTHGIAHSNCPFNGTEHVAQCQAVLTTLDGDREHESTRDVLVDYAAMHAHPQVRLLAADALGRRGDVSCVHVQHLLHHEKEEENRHRLAGIAQHSNRCFLPLKLFDRTYGIPIRERTKRFGGGYISASVNTRLGAEAQLTADASLRELSAGFRAEVAAKAWADVTVLGHTETVAEVGAEYKAEFSYRLDPLDTARKALGLDESVLDWFSRDPAAARRHVSALEEGKTWDHHTDRRIALLHPSLRATVTRFVNAVEKELSIKLRVTSSYRSFDEQTKLYNQGRTTPGKIVTNAKAGQSYHNYGLAVDVVQIKGSEAIWDRSMFKKVAVVGKRLGLEWGGDWNSPDNPHFQHPDGNTVKQLLDKYNAAGKDYTKITISVPQETAEEVKSPQEKGEEGVGDSCKAEGEAGVCGDKTECLSRGGFATAGKCAGEDHIQCCVVKKCVTGGREGTCTPTTNCKHTSVSNLCPGPSDIKCCVEADTSAPGSPVQTGLQGVCDRLHELGFPFADSKPYKKAGCGAAEIKHPWALFQGIYDNTEQKVHQQNGVYSQSDSAAKHLFASNAVRWTEWKKDSCENIFRGDKQTERWATDYTFAYLREDNRMCNLAKAFGGGAVTLTGFSMKAGHKTPYHSWHQEGLSIDLNLPCGLRKQSSGCTKGDAAALAKAVMVLLSPDVREVFLAPSSYVKEVRDEMKKLKATQTDMNRLKYSSGHDNHLHVELLPPPSRNGASTQPDVGEGAFTPQTVCDYLHHLGFPFAADAPYSKSGCTAEAASYPLKLFKGIYDDSSADPSKQSGEIKHPSPTTDLLASSSAVKWEKWVPGPCRTPASGRDWEMYATDHTFLYLDQGRRACQAAEALGAKEITIAGLSDANGFESQYPSGHSRAGEGVGRATHREGLSIEINIPCSDGKCTRSMSDMAKFVKALMGTEVKEVFLSPKTLRDEVAKALAGQGGTNEDSSKLKYASGAGNVVRIELKAPGTSSRGPGTYSGKISIQQACDRLKELGFPFSEEKPYSTDKCDAETIKHPLQLFQAIYDNTNKDVSLQEGSFSFPSGTANKLFSPDAVRWEEWVPRECETIYRGPKQWERWATSYTFEYMRKDSRMCKAAKVLGSSSMVIVGLSDKDGHESRYPAWHEKAGQRVHDRQQEGLSIGLSLPCAQRRSEGSCSSNGDARKVAELMKVLLGPEVKEIFMGPNGYRTEVVQEMDKMGMSKADQAKVRHLAGTTSSILIELNAPTASGSPLPENLCEDGRNLYIARFGSATLAQGGLFKACKELLGKGKGRGRHFSTTSGYLVEPRRWTLFSISQCIPVVFFCIELSFEAAVEAGIRWDWSINVLERKASVNVIPYAGASFTAGAKASIFIARGGVELTARILDTSIPAGGTLDVTRFPVEVCLHADLVIRPLTIRILAVLEIRDKFKIGFFYIKWTWGTRKEWVLWEYAMPPITVSFLKYCRGGREVAQATPGFVSRARGEPTSMYVNDLRMGITWTPWYSSGASSFIYTTKWVDAQGVSTPEQIQEGVRGAELAHPSPVDGNVYSVVVRGCTSLTEQESCSEAVGDSVVYDSLPPKLTFSWEHFEEHKASGCYLVANPKLLCFSWSYEDTSPSQYFRLALGDYPLLAEGEGMLGLGYCFRNVPLEDKTEYTLSLLQMDSAEHETEEIECVRADLTPLNLTEVWTSCGEVFGMQIEVNTFCLTARKQSMPESTVKFEFSLLDGRGEEHLGDLQQNETHVFTRAKLATPLTPGNTYVAKIWALYSGIAVNFPGPSLAVVGPPEVHEVENKVPCQTSSNPLCVITEASKHVKELEGRVVGEREWKKLNTEGCLIDHTAKGLSEAAVEVRALDHFGQISPPLSSAPRMLRDGRPVCHIESDKYATTPDVVCFDMNVTSTGCGVTRVAGRVVDSKGELVVGEVIPERTTFHCLVTSDGALEQLGRYRVELVAADANGEECSAEVGVVVDFMPPNTKLVIPSKVQPVTGSIEFRVIPPFPEPHETDGGYNMSIMVTNWKAGFSWRMAKTVEYGATAMSYTVTTGETTGVFGIVVVSQDTAGNTHRTVGTIGVDATPPVIGRPGHTAAGAGHTVGVGAGVPLVIDFDAPSCGVGVNGVPAAETEEGEPDVVRARGPHGVHVYNYQHVRDHIATCGERVGVTLLQRRYHRPPKGKRATEYIEALCNHQHHVLAAQVTNDIRTSPSLCTTDEVGGLFTRLDTQGQHCSPLFHELPCKDLVVEVAGHPRMRTVDCMRNTTLHELFSSTQHRSCHTVTLGTAFPLLTNPTHYGVLHFNTNGAAISPSRNGSSGVGIDGWALSDAACRKSGNCDVAYPDPVRLFCIPEHDAVDEGQCGESGDEESGMTCVVEVMDAVTKEVYDTITVEDALSATSHYAYPVGVSVMSRVNCTNGVGLSVVRESPVSTVLKMPTGRVESVGGRFLTSHNITLHVTLSEEATMTACLGAWYGDCSYSAMQDVVSGGVSFGHTLPQGYPIYPTVFATTALGLRLTLNGPTMYIDETPPIKGSLTADCGCGEDCRYAIPDMLGTVVCTVEMEGWKDKETPITYNLSLGKSVVARGGVPGIEEVEFHVKSGVETAQLNLEVSNLVSLVTKASVEKRLVGCNPTPNITLVGSKTGAMGTTLVMAQQSSDACLVVTYPRGEVCSVTVYIESSAPTVKHAFVGGLVEDGRKVTVCDLHTLPPNEDIKVQVVSHRCQGCSSTATATLYIDGKAPEIGMPGKTVDYVMHAVYTVDVGTMVHDATLDTVSLSYNGTGDNTTTAKGELSVTLPGAGWYTVCLAARDAGGLEAEKCRRVVFAPHPPTPSDVAVGCNHTTAVLVPVDGVDQLWWPREELVCVSYLPFDSLLPLKCTVSLREQGEGGDTVVSTVEQIRDLKAALVHGLKYHVEVQCSDTFGRTAAARSPVFVRRPEEPNYAATPLSAVGANATEGVLYMAGEICLELADPPSAAARCVVGMWTEAEVPENIDHALDDAVAAGATRVVVSGKSTVCFTPRHLRSVGPETTTFVVRGQCEDVYGRHSIPSQGRVVLDDVSPVVVANPLEAVYTTQGEIGVQFHVSDLNPMVSRITVVANHSGEVVRETEELGRRQRTAVVKAMLPEGYYVLVVTHEDLAGNTGEYKMGFWSVEPSTKPEITVDGVVKQGQGERDGEGAGDSSGTVSTGGERRRVTTLAEEPDETSGMNGGSADVDDTPVEYIAMPSRDFTIAFSGDLPLRSVGFCLGVVPGLCDVSPLSPVLPERSGVYTYTATRAAAGGDGTIFYLAAHYCLVECEYVSLGRYAFDTTPPTVVFGGITAPEFVSWGQEVTLDWTSHFLDTESPLRYVVCLGSVLGEAGCVVKRETAKQSVTLTVPRDLTPGVNATACVTAVNGAGLGTEVCEGVTVANSIPVVNVTFGTGNTTASDVLAQFGVTVSWGVESEVPVSQCTASMALYPANTTEDGSGDVVELGDYDVGESRMWVFPINITEGSTVVGTICCTAKNAKQGCGTVSTTARPARSKEDAYVTGAMDITAPVCPSPGVRPAHATAKHYFGGQGVRVAAGGCWDPESWVEYTVCFKTNKDGGCDVQRTFDDKGGDAVFTNDSMDDGETVWVEGTVSQPWGLGDSWSYEYVKDTQPPDIVVPSSLTRHPILLRNGEDPSPCFPIYVYDAVSGVSEVHFLQNGTESPGSNATHLCVDSTHLGTSTLSVTATDASGLRAEEHFSVTVMDRVVEHWGTCRFSSVSARSLCPPPTLPRPLTLRVSEEGSSHTTRELLHVTDLTDCHELERTYSIDDFTQGTSLVLRWEREGLLHAVQSCDVPVLLTANTPVPGTAAHATTPAPTPLPDTPSPTPSPTPSHTSPAPSHTPNASPTPSPTPRETSAPSPTQPAIREEFLGRCSALKQLCVPDGIPAKGTVRIVNDALQVKVVHVAGCISGGDLEFLTKTSSALIHWYSTEVGVIRQTCGPQEIGAASAALPSLLTLLLTLLALLL